MEAFGSVEILLRDHFLIGWFFFVYVRFCIASVHFVSLLSFDVTLFFVTSIALVFSVSIFHIWPLFLCIRVCNCLRHTFHVFFSNAMVCVFPEYFKHLLMHNAHSATS